MTVNIIVTTLNCLPYTQLCTRSILANTNLVGCRLIYVDDGSNDGTIEWLKTVPGAEVVLSDGKRHGPWGGLNIGLEQGRADYYVFMDRDVVVTPGWLSKLVSLLEQRPEVGMVSPVCSNGPGEMGIPQGDEAYPWPERWPGSHWIPQILSYEDIMAFGSYLEERNSMKWIYNAPLWFQCVVLPHRTVERAGRLDSRFFWADGDVDYCYSILKKGLLMGVRLDTYAHHQGMFYEGTPSRFDTGHYNPQPLTYWYDKYPGTTPPMPEGRDWNSFLPHKEIMVLASA